MSARHRHILNTVLAIALALTGLGASLPSPTDQLRMHVGRILTILEDPAKLEGMTTERRVALRTIVGDVFDFEETSRRALGRHWAARTPVERVEFVDLFRGLLEETYLTKIDSFGDETIRYIGESVDGSEAIVRTRIVPKHGAELPVDYRMHLRGQQWRVYDVVLDGVSLIDNYRAQFNKIIQTSSYRELIAKMQAVDSRPYTARPVRSR